MSSALASRSRRSLVLLFASACSAVVLAQDPPATLLDSGVLVSWPTLAGSSYQLQARPSSVGAWANAGASIAGTGSDASVFHAGPVDASLYQVVETYTVVTAAPDLALNASFETGTGGAADSWTYGGTQQPSRISTDARTGTFSARSSLVNIGSSPAEGLLQQTVLPAASAPTVGQSYTLSFYAKQVSSGPSYVQQYWLQWLNASGGIIGGTGLQNFNGTIGQWVKVTAGAQSVPAGTAGYKIVFRFVTGAVSGGHGEVLIDDVSLAPAGGTTTTTQTRIQPVTTTAAGRMRWTGAFGVRYQPETSTDLAEWLPAAPAVDGTGAELSFSHALTAPARFLRVSYPDTPVGPVVDGVTPLFSSTTTLEAPVLFETSNALVTRFADRVRDRHAREAIYNSYDHYLPFYWEQRVADIEIVDEIAKGGNRLVFNYSTLAQLNPAEFRAFYLGRNTVAEYHYNAIAPFVSTSPSVSHPGETSYNYSIALQTKLPENRPLQMGDLVEIELSQFLLSVRNGRLNYYGTTFLYIVGEGIVPWYEENEYTPGGSRESRRVPDAGWLGGRTTLPYQYSNEPEHRFKQMAGNLSPTNGNAFMLGRRLHHTDFATGAHSEAGNPVFTQHAGKLGPRFIAASCVDCHVNNGRSLPAQTGGLVVRSVVKVAADAAGNPHPQLGEELQPYASSGPGEGNVTLTGHELTQGTYGDGTPFTLRKPTYSFSGIQPAFYSVRAAPQLVGLGLLEAVPETAVAALADPDDANSDGISGRMHVVEDPAAPGTFRLGRFTHKASQAKVSHQIAYALNRDMGVASALFPVLDGATTPSTPELTETELDQMNRYVALLGVGAKRGLHDPVVVQGGQLFQSMNCTACHTPSLTTSAHHPMAELRSQTIRPFTDLLLHDMGPGLADTFAEEGASASEWRTAPLWNIGLTQGVSGGEAYLHDGRAATLEEAILWHGGEAEASKEAFRTAPAASRQALIQYLRSL